MNLSLSIFEQHRDLLLLYKNDGNIPIKLHQLFQDVIVRGMNMINRKGLDILLKHVYFVVGEDYAKFVLGESRSFQRIELYTLVPKGFNLKIPGLIKTKRGIFDDLIHFTDNETYYKFESEQYGAGDIRLTTIEIEDEQELKESYTNLATFSQKCASFVKNWNCIGFRDRNGCKFAFTKLLTIEDNFEERSLEEKLIQVENKYVRLPCADLFYIDAITERSTLREQQYNLLVARPAKVYSVNRMNNLACEWIVEKMQDLDFTSILTKVMRNEP